MKRTVGFAIPTTTKNKLSSLAGPLNHSQFLEALLYKKAAAELHFEEDPVQKTSYFIDQDTIDILDNIVARNNLKSRNQAVTLLIEKAWKERNETT